jgi:LmbE family N-acetylglucosaminyl deacetylase
MRAMTEQTGLESLDERWQRAVAIVAHPDDLEFGAAAAVARWTGQGKQVGYAMVTSGEAGIDGMPPERCGPLREREQRDSAAVVGVDTVDFLGFPDGVVEYGLPLRREIARLVRRHRPEVVITGNFHDTWDGVAALNQADHIATGRAVVDGVRDAGNRWVFTDLLDGGLEPWGGVREIWVANSPRARHGVDVTDTFDRGVASLQAHEEYLRGLGSGTFDPEEFLTSLCRQVGTRMGCRYAVAFEVFPLQSF